MWQKLITRWHPPALPDPDENHTARVLNAILWMACGVMIILTPMYALSNSDPGERLISIGVDAVIFVFVLGMIFYLRRGYVKFVSRVLVSLIYLALLPFQFFGENLSLLAVEYMALLVVAGLLLSVRSVTWLGVISMLTFAVGMLIRVYNFQALEPLTQRAFWDGVVALIIMGVIILMFRTAMTSLHQNIARARQSEARARALLDAVPDTIFRLNFAGVFLDYQTNENKVLFTAPELFLGKPVEQVLPPKLARQIQDTLFQAIDTNTTQAFEYQLAMPDGVRDFEARLIKSGPDEVTAMVRDITLRRHAEIERHKQETRLQTYLNSSPVAVYLFDLETYTPAFFNREEFCGYSKAELETPGSIQSTIHPDDKDALKAHWAQITRGEHEKSTAVFRLQNKAGDWEWIEETKSVITRKGDGTPKELLVTLSIITAHKQAEEKIHQLNTELELRVEDRTRELAASIVALRQSELRYQNVTELISEFAFSAYARPDGTPVIDWLTPSVERVTGYTPEEFLAQDSWTSILHPDERESGKARYRVGISPRPIDAEIRIVTKQGDIRWAWTRARPEFDAAGKPVRLLGIVTDITERKLAETALRDSEAKLRALFDLLPVGVSVLAPDRQVVEVNSAMEKILGVEREQLFLGKYTERQYFGADGSPMSPSEFASFRAFTEKRPIYDVEIGVVKEDGQLIWTNVNATPLPDGRVVVVTTDITGRKHTEAALRQQNAYLKALHEITLDVLNRRDSDDVLNAIIDYASALLEAPYSAIRLAEDEDTLTTRVFSKALQLLGTHKYAFKRPLGKLAWQAFDTGQSVIIDDYINFADRNPALDHLELRAGLNIPLMVGEKAIGVMSLGRQVKNYPFTPEQIQFGVLLAQLAAVALDNANLYEAAQQELTARKLTQERLSILYETLSRVGAQLHLDAVVQTAVETIGRLSPWGSVAISLPNPDGQTWTTRAAWGSMVGRFGKARALHEGVIGRTYRTGNSQLVPDVHLDPEYFVGDDQPISIRSELAVPIKLREEILGVLNLESERENAFTTEDLILAELLAEALALALDNAQLYTDAQYELNERQLAEIRLQTANAELVRSNTDLERFAYAVSHDLQEPLRQVTQFSQLLARHYQSQLSPDADEMIQFIVDGTGRMNEMIKGLLDYSRIGRENQALVRVDCNAVLKNALNNLKLRMDENAGVTTADLLPLVKGNEVLLSLLFQNLLNNALKFRSEKPPHIHISARRVERSSGIKEWVVCVRDNGIGIAPEYFERIFVIFQRLHTREEYPGLGIGLALCKRIVELHRGRIWVESIIGEGSSFYFTLPVAAEE